MRTTLVATAALAALAALAVAPASAQKMIGGNPGPAYNYVCPNADGAPPLDCYYDAVRHLYTMCRHVKSIEIIEWGFEKSQQGVNDAKSNSCIEKQRGNMAKPYQAALKEAALSKQAVDGVKSLNEAWQFALADLKWRAGETSDDYLTRTVTPYMDFEERIDGIKLIVETVRSRVRPLPAQAPAKPAAPKAAAPKAAAAPK
ncbi:MAG TPA: hypothetical protein VII68_04615 [Casimicrobiaceae bacterium]|jgi:hypothetical protein